MLIMCIKLSLNSAKNLQNKIIYFFDFHQHKQIKGYHIWFILLFSIYFLFFLPSTPSNLAYSLIHLSFLFSYFQCLSKPLQTHHLSHSSVLPSVSAQTPPPLSSGFHPSLPASVHHLFLCDPLHLSALPQHSSTAFCPSDLIGGFLCPPPNKSSMTHVILLTHK